MPLKNTRNFLTRTLAGIQYNHCGTKKDLKAMRYITKKEEENDSKTLLHILLFRVFCLQTMIL